MELPIHPGIVLGTIAATLSLISFMQKSMLPLRGFAIASNVFFITYGYID